MSELFKKVFKGELDLYDLTPLLQLAVIQEDYETAKEIRDIMASYGMKIDIPELE